MFSVYSKRKENGRAFNRYYRSWENAEHDLISDKDELVESGWKVVKEIDRMNVEKGVYEYQFDLVSPKGEKMILAILDGYFQD